MLFQCVTFWSLTGVVDSVNDGTVDLNKHDCWVFEGNFKGLDEGIDEDRRHIQVLLVNFAL